MAKTIIVMVHGEAESGKSTFIDAISEIHFQPDASALDFGLVVIEDDRYLIYLFAYSGGQRLPELEKLNEANKRYTCCVIVNPSKTINGKRHYYEETKEIIEDSRQRGTPILIVANRRKAEDSYSIGELCEILQIPETMRFLECDPVSNPTSAKRVLVELFRLLPEDELVTAVIERLQLEI